MNEIQKNDFVKNLVRLLLQSEMEEENDQLIKIDRKTFNQILLYILMGEVLGADKAVIDEHLLTKFDEMMVDLQEECSGILALLTTKE